MTGGFIDVRAVLSEDVPPVVEMLEGLSVESSYRRFLGAARTSAARYANTLTSAEAALVAVHAGEVLGVGSLHRESLHSAELALAIRDHDQGHGIGTLLLEHLVAAGRGAGLERLTAEVLSENNPMLTVLRELGLRVTLEAPDLGVVRVTIDLGSSAEFDRRTALRSAMAEATSVSRLLRPASIGVLADHSHRKLARRALRTLQSNGFTGQLRHLSPSVPIPPRTDLVVLATSGSHVLEAIIACAGAGVGGVVIEEPAHLTGTLMSAVLEEARQGGLRVLGPGAHVVVNTDRDVRLCLGLGDPADVPAGRTALVGAGAALRRAVKTVRETGTGVSIAIDIGDGLDVDLRTAVNAALKDDGTAAVAVSAPPGYSASWHDLSLAADSLGKPVMVVDDQLQSQDEAAVVRLGSRDMPAALAVTAALRSGSRPRGVLVVGDRETAEALRSTLRSRGICEGGLTQQAEMRLRHLRSQTLVSGGPAPDSEPGDLVSTVATIAECPDVGVIIVAAPRPTGVAQRRRLVRTLSELAPIAAGSRVIGFVPGGLRRAPVPTFADPDTCAAILRFADRWPTVA